MAKCVVFDMDGTLVNSFEGIFHAYRWAFQKLGRPFPGEVFVQKAVGAPPKLVFERFCGMDPDTAAQAVGHYRQYYAEKGQYQATVYAGMAEALRSLRDAGCLLGVATLKNEGFARDMLSRLGLLAHFHTVCGMDADDRLTKAALLRRCMQRMKSAPEETVLVGDSAFDLQGAGEAGAAFLPVTYGFGFQSREEREALGGAADRIILPPAAAPADIPRRLGCPPAPL